MMSTVTATDEKSDEVCASCGTAAIDDVKLKDCDDGCDLVKYCSGECQENNRPQHVKACKKWKAELRDRDLFTMPDSSYLGECPICFLPLPLNQSESAMMPCCSKLVCNGCRFANEKRENEAGLQRRCAFCREPTPNSKEEYNKNVTKRIKKNDPDAMSFMGMMRLDEEDYESAFEYFAKAAELGNASAHYVLSCLYREGECVEKDVKKYTYHAEKAAISGHPHSRHYLGIEEWENGNFQRAKKHWIINANLGYHGSLSNLKILYADGHASKEDYADALRAYQTAVEEAKSTEREEAEAYYTARGI